MKIQKKILPFILIMFLFFLLTFTIPVFTDTVTSKKPIKITFIGNSGFIIETGGKKIAIDAFFNGFPGRYTLPKNVIHKMKKSVGPFNNIDLILSTHLHADHLKVGYVSDYLVKNKETEFFATDEAINIMEKNHSEFNLYSNRAHGLNPGWGEIKNISFNGIEITAVGIPHGRNPVQHNCIIFRAGKKNFVHLGDMSGDKVQSVFKKADIKDMKFDIAFIPFWYLTNQKNAEIIKRNINSEQIIAMHLSLTDSNRDIPVFIKKILAFFPKAIIFQKELDFKNF